MKKLFQLITLLMLAITASFAQFTQATWTGAISSSWSDPLNWSGSSVPAVGYNVEIGTPQTGGYNLVLTGAATCENLTIVSGGTVNISDNSAAGVLLVKNKLWIQSGAALVASNATHPGTITVNGDFVRDGNFNPSSSGNFIFAGSGLQTVNTISSPTLNFSRLTINYGSTVQILGGPVAIGGSLVVNGVLKADPSTNYTITLSGTPAMSVAPGNFIPGASTVIYASSSATTIAGVEYNNLTFTATPGVTFTATSALTINGTLNINIGKFDPGTGVHSIKGSIQKGSNGTIIDNGSFNFCGTSAQTIPLLTYANIKVNNTAGVTLSGATGGVTVREITIGDVVANSTLNDGGHQILLASGVTTLTMSSSALLKLGDGSTATQLPNFTLMALSGATTTPTVNPGSTIEYIATSAQTVTGVSYVSLSLKGSGSIKTLNSCTVSGTLLIDLNVSATIPSGSTITSSGTLTNNGNITLDGSFYVQGSVGTQAIGILNSSSAGRFFITPSAGPQTIDLGTSNSLGPVQIGRSGGSEVMIFVGSTPSTFKNLDLASNAVIAPANNWTVTGLLHFSGTATLSVGSDRIMTLSDIDLVSPKNISNAGIINITGQTITNVNYSGAGTLNFDPSGPATYTFNNFTSNGLVIFNGGSNEMDFNVTTLGTFNNITMNNTAAFTMPGNWTVNGNLSVGTGANFNLGNGQLTFGGVKGSLTESTAGKVSCNPGSGTAEIIFTGSGAQTLTVSAATRDYSDIKLTVQKTGGNLYIVGGDIKINTLTFTSNAAIDMGGHNVIFMGTPGYTGTAVGSTGAQIFNGTISTIVNAATAYTFPVGDGTQNTPLILTSATSSPGLTTVGFKAAAPGGTIPNLSFTSSSAPSLSIIRASGFYWTVDVANTLVGRTDLSLNVKYNASDPFQSAGDVRLILRNLDTDPWTKIEGTTSNGGYANIPNTGSNISNVIVTGASAAVSPGTKKIAFGLCITKVSIAGKVYYGDAPATSGFGHADLVVRVQDIGDATLLFTNSVAVTASGTYTISNVSGMVSAQGYLGMVSTFPATSKFPISMIDAGDAIAAINTAVGHVTGAISSANTMARIAADVNRDNATLGRVACSGSAVATVGGEPVWSTSPSITINVIDAMLILQRAVNPNTVFPAGTYYSSTFTTGTNLTQDHSNQIIRILAMGDCKVDGVPAMTAKQKVMFAEKGSVDVDAKTAFSIPIRLESDAVNAAAFTIAAKYPADKVEYKGIVSSIAGVSAYASDGYVR
ncbi:MAG: hypothetical protein NTX44_11250, partial [Ignavibacteriales bacterium]|nr:hypothetical protein [Ignavibacteriales bacterium]